MDYHFRGDLIVEYAILSANMNVGVISVRGRNLAGISESGQAARQRACVR